MATLTGVRRWQGIIWWVPTVRTLLAAQQQLLPIICVECNRTVRMTRPVAPVPESESDNVSVLPYSGMCQSADESVDVLGTSSRGGLPATGWPASVLFGKGKLRNGAALKAGTPEQLGWQIMLPVSVPLVFHPGRCADGRPGQYVLRQRC